jgi:hypothetical protein
MSDAEVLALQGALSELRKENTEEHHEIFRLVRDLAARQDKMNGGLGTLKWIIGAVLTITIPLTGLLMARGL